MQAELLKKDGRSLKDKVSKRSWGVRCVLELSLLVG